MTPLETYVQTCQQVEQEVSHHRLPVTAGHIPAELRGYLFCNGAGRMQHQGVAYQHPFDGDGMISKVYFTDEGAYYSNRYVRTHEFVTEERAGKMLYRSFGTNLPGGMRKNLFKMRFKNAANTSVVYHGGKLLALWEGGLPHEIDPETLETLSRFDYQGVLKNSFSWLDQQIFPELAFSAHPKIDPNTGILYNFGTVPGTKRRLILYEVGPDGKAVIAQAHELSEMTFVHDFVLTRQQQIFFLTPVSFDLLQAFSGRKTPVASIRSQTDKPTRILVMQQGQATYYETDACFVFHFTNGYQENEDTLIVDGLRMDTFPDAMSAEHLANGTLTEKLAVFLHRYRINLRTGTVEHHPLSDYPMELPAIHPDRQGQAYRYVWAMAGDPQQDSPLLHGIAKVDVMAETTHYLDLTPHLPGEPLFVPRPGSAQEDDGWLLTMLFDTDEKISKLLIVDAKTMQIEGALTLPHAQPVGFHGTWVDQLS